MAKSYFPITLLLLGVVLCGCFILHLRQTRNFIQNNLTPDQAVTLTLTPKQTRLAFGANVAGRTLSFDTTDVRFLLNQYPENLKSLPSSFDCSLGGVVSAIQLELTGLDSQEAAENLSLKVTEDIAGRKGFNPQDPDAMSFMVDGLSYLYNIHWFSEYKYAVHWLAVLSLLPGVLLCLTVLFKLRKTGYLLSAISLLALLYASVTIEHKLSKNILAEYTRIDWRWLVFSTQPTTLAQDTWQPGRSWDIDYSDVEEILGQLGTQLHFISPISHTGFLPLQTADGNGSSSKEEFAEVIGITPDFWLAYPVWQDYGRFFSPMDMVSHPRFCILGKELSNKLFGPNQNPCGMTVLQNNIPFEVVGVIHNTNKLLNPVVAIDWAMMIPITTDFLFYNTPRNVWSFSTVVKNENEQSSTIEQIRRLLCLRHHISPEDQDALSIVNLHDQLAVFSDWYRKATLVLTLIAIGAGLAFVCSMGLLLKEYKKIEYES